MEKKSGSSFWIILIAIFVLCKMFEACGSQEHSDYYYEHKSAIDTYERNHANDWNGYQGTRRNSLAEDEKLKSNGYDPEKYRASHGY